MSGFNPLLSSLLRSFESIRKANLGRFAKAIPHYESPLTSRYCHGFVKDDGMERRKEEIIRDVEPFLLKVWPGINLVNHSTPPVPRYQLYRSHVWMHRHIVFA